MPWQYPTSGSRMAYACSTFCGTEKYGAVRCGALRRCAGGGVAAVGAALGSGDGLGGGCASARQCCE